MTREELARRLYETWHRSISESGTTIGEPLGWKDETSRIKNACLAEADAAFAALGVTPDPELPPGPWHVITGSYLKLGTADEPNGRILASGTRTELWLRAAVAAWNKANGFAEGGR